MLQIFKSLRTTKADWVLTWKSLVQTLRILPQLILFNSIFISILLTLEIAWFYWIMSRLVDASEDIKNMIINVGFGSFSILAWTFLVFLVPYYLYNNTYIAKKAPLILKAFIKNNISPMIIESIKVLFALMGYAFGTTLIFLLVVFCMVYMNLLDLSDLESLEKINLNTILKSKTYIILFFIGFVTYVPVCIKFVQYLFMPYVVFFHQNFKNNSLSLSSKASCGLVIPVIVILSTRYFIQKIIFFDPLIEDFQLLRIGVNSLFYILMDIIYIALLYFMYVQKDPSHVK